ncbi:MAG TPA: hypothetical protein VNC84_02250 [Gammaproteobacteria bacterium]|jgi:folate-binding protein YgfZ|nr:hypothetical protein [Gammaproteobacteria bacterium]
MTTQYTTLNEAGLLKVTGADAKKFLQGQLTCDVEQAHITPQMGAHCQPQGRVLSLFYLFYHESDYYLLMKRAMIQIALAALKKYAIFYKVDLVDVSTDFAYCTCDGASPSLTEGVVIPIKNQRNTLIFNKLPEKIKEALLALPVADEKSRDILEGIPQLYPEISGAFLPHELNLVALNGVNFHKGCFTGQEIIARMEYRGKLKSQLYSAYLETGTQPDLGSNVYANESNVSREVGRIVNVSLCEKGCYVLMVVDKSHARNDHLYLENQTDTFLNILEQQ